MASGSPRGSGAGAKRAVGDRRAGIRILIPGGAQWAWRQRERAVVYFGTFAAAMAVGLFTWGTKAGSAMLLFAFAAHVASTSDAIRQCAFPGFGRFVPAASASVGLGLGCYAPALAMATVLAWPGLRLGAPNEGYLVNRWAYQGNDPTWGHWIWYETPDRLGHCVAQVLAGPGQGVEWSDGRLIVAGQAVPWVPPKSSNLPHRMTFTVPDGQVLISAPTGSLQESSCGMVFIPRERLAGRAWAKMYPIWGRAFLF